MRLLLFIIIFSLTLSGNGLVSENMDSSNSQLLSGTIIIAAICEDGILFASDSRSAFLLNKKLSNRVYAYFDNTQKLFKIGKYLIGVSGRSMLNKTFFNNLVGEFNISHNTNAGIAKTFTEFFDFLKTEKHLTDSIIFSKNDYIIAGYETNESIVLAQHSSEKMSQKNIGRMIHSHPDFREYVKISRNIKLTCKNVAPILEAAINKYATDKNDYQIGGPLDIIQIKPDNTHEVIKSFSPNNFKTYKEMAAAIINKKIKVNYIYHDFRPLKIIVDFS